MPRKSMTPHTVHLFNFVGEVKDVATYQEAVIQNCYCNLDDGVTSINSGRTTNDTARLYIFKRDMKVKSPDGAAMKYLPFEKWMELADKTGYWTINPNDRDYFVMDGRTSRLKVKRFADNEVGSRRMWHFEVDGK